MGEEEREVSLTRHHDSAGSWTDLAGALLEAELVRETEKSDKTEKSVRAAQRALDDAEAAFARALESDAPLAGIATFAELDGCATRVLALCGAIDRDRRLQRLVAKLTADPSDGRPDYSLVVRLLGEQAGEALAPDGRLRSSGLLDLAESVPLAAARVTVPPVVSWALGGTFVLDAGLPPQAEIVAAPAGAFGEPELVLVHGLDRVRRVQTAVTAAWGPAFLVTPAPTDLDGWRAVVRQATVSGVGVVLELDSAPDALMRQQITAAGHLTWALCSTHPMPLEALPDLQFTEVRAFDAAVSDDEWYSLYPDNPLPSRRPNASQLELTQKIVSADAESAFRRLASGALLKHARRIEPRLGWDALILPAAQERRLRQLVDRYRHRALVHEQWNLPLYPSPGIVTLFAGPSGTGKTTAAEVIAHDLGMEMFRIDLSAIVSKYIGETEKNLEEIFSAAHAGEYLLLFDEADSLFGSRSEVSDSRDRYANMEVSYLLQRLETYDGFVVLTSNYQGNIDDAFLRRIHAAVHFPMPAVVDRQRIWDRCLGSAPRSDVDLDHLAQNFELSGGSIRNAALSAAYLAAGQGKEIGMVEALTGVSQEMAKLRQRVPQEKYGRWGEQVSALG
jgi:DNA polymerase III delta prime subunit